MGCSSTGPIEHHELMFQQKHLREQSAGATGTGKFRNADDQLEQENKSGPHISSLWNIFLVL